MSYFHGQLHSIKSSANIRENVLGGGLGCCFVSRMSPPLLLVAQTPWLLGRDGVTAGRLFL